ncbi:hypothetical protein [Bathymodiolus platifrons methanotrophic gill symbiont]|nr:hypothetical protein [Bathymodiolus platifrons methanotrophic gill symbiont]
MLNEKYPDLAASLIAQGQQQERERIAAIIDSESADGRGPLARHLAFETDMAPDAANAALKAAPVSKPVKAVEANNTSGFERAMATVNNPDIEPASDEQEENIDDVAQRLASYQ